MTVTMQRFNSAAAVMPRKLAGMFRWTRILSTLQFGRGCYAAETRGSMNPMLSRTSLQFGRGCYAAETPCSPPSASIVDQASIRPRLLCRGNPVWWGACCSRQNSFNSAAAVMPRKLQQHLRRRRPAPASIRPRLLCRGNIEAGFP